MTAPVTCRHCGEAIERCTKCVNSPEEFAWIHADSKQHPCSGGLFYAEAETAPPAGQSISGRSEPRPSREHVTHAVRWRGVADGSLRASCDCGDRRTVEADHLTEELVRFDVMHSGGAA